LILRDVAMPKLNGVATASVLRRLMPKTPIILFTRYEDAADRIGQAVGAELVLSKPDGIHSLVQRVQEVVSARTGDHINSSVHRS
jgi:CheY-like chemotaxis protein